MFLDLIDNKCLCVGKHVPLPHNYVKVEDVFLCPTSYSNLCEFLLEWDKYGGEPPGNVRKHYSDYIQELAKRIIND